MKQLVLMICLGSFIIFTGGCKKNCMKSSSLIGSWELRKASSGMVPERNYPPGNGNILKFFDNSTYEQYVNGQLAKTGPYTIIADSTAEASTCLLIQPGEYTDRVVYDNDYNARKQFIQINGKNLSIISGCFAVDAGQKLIYERQ